MKIKVSQTTLRVVVNFTMLFVCLLFFNCNKLDSYSKDNSNKVKSSKSSSNWKIIHSICYDKIFPVQKSDIIIQIQTFCFGYIMEGIIMKLRNGKLQTWKYKFNDNWALGEEDDYPILDNMYEIKPKDAYYFTKKVQQLPIESIANLPEIEITLQDDNFLEQLNGPRDFMLKIIHWYTLRRRTRFCGCAARIQLFNNFKYKEIQYSEWSLEPKCIAEKYAQELYYLIEDEFGLQKIFK